MLENELNKNVDDLPLLYQRIFNIFDSNQRSEVFQLNANVRKRSVFLVQLVRPI
jgi:hypothetical protein